MAKAVTQFAKSLQESIPNHISKVGYDKWFGHSVNVISAGKGFCIAEMTIKPEHVNVQGRLHGGCTATLVDMTTALALISAGKTGVSVEINVSYLKGANLGEVILLDAKALRIGKSMAFLALEIKRKEDNSLIATGKHVVFLDRSDTMSSPKNPQ